MTILIDIIYLSSLSIFAFNILQKAFHNSRKLLTLIYLESTIFIFSLFGVFSYYILKLDNNLFIYHILSPIQYYLTSRLLKLYLTKTELITILYFLDPVVIVLNVIFSLSLQKITEYNSYSLILNNTIIGMFSIFLLWETLHEFDRKEVFAKYWIAIGLFTNSFCAFFIQGFMNIFIVKRIDFAFKLYLFEMSIYILSTFLLLKAFYSEILLVRNANGNK